MSRPLRSFDAGGGPPGPELEDDDFDRPVPPWDADVFYQEYKRVRDQLMVDEVPAARLNKLKKTVRLALSSALGRSALPGFPLEIAFAELHPKLGIEAAAGYLEECDPLAPDLARRLSNFAGYYTVLLLNSRYAHFARVMEGDLPRLQPQNEPHNDTE
ncbi:hypothetical protein CO046_00325 [Candidatus Peregrinibacteria bacterium CG_4_9_14_0_2_um_filter_53_11]|nr:MAG: hypothetical protein CO046_00325 [Candidatus Peregrinibacteria bacterium CG_4_9_14_0_2_um_filter_53_11]